MAELIGYVSLGSHALGGSGDLTLGSGTVLDDVRIAGRLLNEGELYEPWRWNDAEAWNDEELWIEGTALDMPAGTVSDEITLSGTQPHLLLLLQGSVQDEITVGPAFLDIILPMFASVQTDVQISAPLGSVQRSDGSIQAEIQISGSLRLALPLNGSVQTEHTISGQLRLVSRISGSIEAEHVVSASAMPVTTAMPSTTIQAEVLLGGVRFITHTLFEQASIQNEVVISGALVEIKSLGTGSVQDEIAISSTVPQPIVPGPTWLWHAGLRSWYYDAGPYLGSKWLYFSLGNKSITWPTSYPVYHGMPGYLELWAVPSIDTPFNDVNQGGFAYTHQPGYIQDDIDPSTLRLFVVNRTYAHEGYMAPQPPAAPPVFYPASYATGGTGPEPPPPGVPVGNWEWNASYREWMYVTPYLSDHYAPAAPELTPETFPVGYAEITYTITSSTTYGQKGEKVDYNLSTAESSTFLGSSNEIYKYRDAWADRPAVPYIVVMARNHTYPRPTALPQGTWEIAPQVTPESLLPPSYATGGTSAEPPPPPQRPANDNWANRIPLPVETGELILDHREATYEAADYGWTGYEGNAWFTYTSPVDRMFELSTGVADSTTYGVHAYIETAGATSQADLKNASADHYQSEILTPNGQQVYFHKFIAKAGVTYSIEVTDGQGWGESVNWDDPFGRGDGYVKLMWRTAAATKHDNLTDAKDLGSFVNFYDYVPVMGLSYETNEPNVAGGGGSSWVRWSPTFSEPFSFKFEADSWSDENGNRVYADLLVIVYTMDANGNLVEVTRADTLALTGSAKDAIVNFDAVAGTTYYIQIQLLNTVDISPALSVRLQGISKSPRIDTSATDPLLVPEGERYPTITYDNVNDGAYTTSGTTTTYIKWTAPDYIVADGIRDTTTIYFPGQTSPVTVTVWIVDYYTEWGTPVMRKITQGYASETQGLTFFTEPGATYIFLVEGQVQGHALQMALRQGQQYAVGPWITPTPIKYDAYYDMSGGADRLGWWRWVQHFAQPWPQLVMGDREEAFFHATLGDYAETHFDDTGTKRPFPASEVGLTGQGYLGEERGMRGAGGDRLLADRGYFMIPAFFEAWVNQLDHSVHIDALSNVAAPPPTEPGQILEYESFGTSTGYSSDYTKGSSILKQIDVNFRLVDAIADHGPWEVHLAAQEPFVHPDGRVTYNAGWNTTTSMYSIAHTAVGKSPSPGTHAPVSGDAWTTFVMPEGKILNSYNTIKLRTWHDRTNAASQSTGGGGIPTVDVGPATEDGDTFDIFLPNGHQAFRAPVVQHARYRYLVPIVDSGPIRCPPRDAMPRGQGDLGAVDRWATYQGAYSYAAYR